MEAATATARIGAHANGKGGGQANRNGATKVKPEPAAREPGEKGKGNAADEQVEPAKPQRNGGVAEPGPEPQEEDDHPANR